MRFVFGWPALLLSDLGQQRESFADGGLSFAGPTAGTQARSCATENFDPGRSHSMRSIVLQFSICLCLLATAPFVLGQSESKNAAVVNGGATISYMKPARIAVATEGRPSWGAPDAPVTI